MRDENLVRQIQSMPPLQQVAAMAGVVERAAPVFRRLARPDSIPTFERALTALWRAAGGDRSNANGARDQLNELPEASIEDSNRAEYHAMGALALAVYALELAADGNAEMVDVISGSASDLYDGLDTLAVARPGQTWMYDPENPPAPGPLGARELNARAEDVNLLSTRKEQLTPDALHAIQASSHIVAAVVDEAVIRLASRLDWRCNRP